MKKLPVGSPEIVYVPDPFVCAEPPPADEFAFTHT